jgi:hypothetical protein
MDKLISVSTETCYILENISKDCGIPVKPAIELMIEIALKDDEFLNKYIIKLSEMHFEKESIMHAKEAAKEADNQAKIIEREERRKRSAENAIERDNALFYARRERKKLLIKSPEYQQELVDRKLATSKAKAIAEDIDLPIRLEKSKENHALKVFTQYFKENIDENVKLMAYEIQGFGYVTLNDHNKTDFENLRQIFPDIHEGTNKFQHVRDYIESQLIFVRNTWFDYVKPKSQKQQDIINDLKSKHYEKF